MSLDIQSPTDGNSRQSAAELPRTGARGTSKARRFRNLARKIAKRFLSGTIEAVRQPYLFCFAIPIAQSLLCCSSSTPTRR